MTVLEPWFLKIIKHDVSIFQLMHLVQPENFIF